MCILCDVMFLGYGSGGVMSVVDQYLQNTPIGCVSCVVHQIDRMQIQMQYIMCSVVRVDLYCMQHIVRLVGWDMEEGARLVIIKI